LFRLTAEIYWFSSILDK